MEVWNELPPQSARPHWHVLMLVFPSFSRQQYVFPSLGHLRELLSAQSHPIPRICFTLAWMTLTLVAHILATTQETCEGQARHIVSLASHRLRPWLQSSRVNSSLSTYQVFTSRVPGAALFKMANSLRPASACALQVIWVVLVWHLLWQLIRPALVLGCLSSRGPLGPRLASTMHGFGASMLPISAAKVSWANCRSREPR
jgi:hypothetical protein